MARTICNKCGKKLDKYDKYGGIAFNAYLGYGTAFDGDTVSFTLCCSCTEEQIHTWLDTFTRSPLMEEEG